MHVIKFYCLVNETISLFYCHQHKIYIADKTIDEVVAQQSLCFQHHRAPK